MSRAPTVLVDGEVAEAARALSATDRGFLLGDSVFEVLRVYGGVPFLLDAHLTRLAASCARVGIACPEPEALTKDVRSALRAFGEADAYLRVVVTRGEGVGLGVPRGTPPRRVVVAAPLVLLPASAYQDGVPVRVVTSPFEAGALRGGGAKTSSYLEHVLAAEEARAHGAVEALFMASTGQILEGAASNVFVVRGGALVTPPASTGILVGITRTTVLTLARRAGIPAREALVTYRDLRDADEVFVTSSIRELLPVAAVDRRKVGEGRPGPVYTALKAAYDAEVAAERGRFPGRFD